jgi:hypothetical protein
MAKTTKLSSTVTVEQYEELERNNDRQRIARFVRDRFNERYFCPIEAAPRQHKHGFASLAVCCLVIETLESFYQGLGDTNRKSARMFRNFFARNTPLRVFGDDDWFYNDIRCGILHLGETRNGWRVMRSGPLLDKVGKTINATKFLHELRKVVDSYASQLVNDDNHWERFKEKMRTVCDNCELAKQT